MAEEKKEPWLNYLALTTVLLAVCATLATFKGGGYGSQSIMKQSQASDQWSYYQSKGIKQYLYELQKDKLEMDLKIQDKPSEVVTATYQKSIENYVSKIKKYEGEKKEIEKAARDLEQVRDDSQKHAQGLGKAVIFLQISILLSSIAALLKKKMVWILGLATGAIGLVYFADGFLLFLK